jgi:hypothetical protein
MSERLKSSLPGYLSFSTALFGPNVGFLHCTLWIMKARSLLSSAAGNAVPVPAGKRLLFSLYYGTRGISGEAAQPGFNNGRGRGQPRADGGGRRAHATPRPDRCCPALRQRRVIFHSPCHFSGICRRSQPSFCLGSVYCFRSRACGLAWAAFLGVLGKRRYCLLRDPRRGLKL